MADEVDTCLTVDDAYVRRRSRRAVNLVGMITGSLTALGLVGEYVGSPGQLRGDFGDRGAIVFVVLVTLASYALMMLVGLPLLRFMLRQRYVAVTAGRVRICFGIITRTFDARGGQNLVLKRDDERGRWLIGQDVGMRGSIALPIRAFPELDSFLKKLLPAVVIS